MHRIITVSFYICFITVFLCASSSFGQIINGDFSNGLSGWDSSGDVSTTTDGFAILQTGGVEGPYITSLSTDFIVAGDLLTFRYFFDRVGPDEIKDPDFPSFGPDFFQMNLSVDESSSFDIPLAWNPTGGFVSYFLDISSMAIGTRATLSFMLFDEDDGYISVAAIDDVSDPVMPTPEAGTLLLLGSGLIGLFISGRYRVEVRRSFLCLSIGCVVLISFNGIAHGEWVETNVDDRIQLEFTAPIFNMKSSILTLDMTATNISEAPLFTPLKIVITGISTPYVTVSNPDGHTSEGIPFFDMTPEITDAELSPGEKTPAKKIYFYNPKRVKFRWDQDVVAFIDVYPERGPVIENICLIPGEASPTCEFYYKDFGVEDPEFDRLLQNPLPEMYRYERIRVYAFDSEDLPLRVTINGTEAIYSEGGFYYYRDIVLEEGLNAISIEVTNEIGISIRREISLNIDSVPPEIKVLEPANAAIVTEMEPVITGIIDDPGVNNIILRENFISQEEVPVIDGTFSARVTLSPGHNDMRLTATDIAGNSASCHLDIIYVYLERGEITGRIYNSILGLPVSGVNITAISGSDDSRSTVSGRDGSYRLEGVRSGDITLLIEKDGYISGRLNIFSPGGVTAFIQNVVLIPINTSDTFTLTGQVKDTGGSPLSGARISIEGSSLAAVSDDNGIYIIRGISRMSFGVEVFREMYEGTNLTVSTTTYSDKTTILVYNFVLKEMANSIGIISPAYGEYVYDEDLFVVGFIRSGGRNAGVQVNGIPAWVYDGYFVANDVPLAEGANRITAEMMAPSGTLLTDSVEVILSEDNKRGLDIHMQEAGIVPVELSIAIEEPPGIYFEESIMEISGPGTAELTPEGPLQWRVSIKDPGRYTIKINAIDSAGNRYEDTFGFTGMAREDVEEMLKVLWTKFKNDLIANNIEAALSIFTPETRGRYAEQFFLLGGSLPDIFTNMGDIQIISLKDNLAKTRVYEGEITHYVWFARDIYGQWKIHKF